MVTGKQSFVAYREPLQRTSGMLKLITNFGVYTVSQHPTLEQLAEYAVKATAKGITPDKLIFRVMPIKVSTVADALRVE